jgi:stage II sporulation protein D
MQSAECRAGSERQRNALNSRKAGFAFHSALCILYSAFCILALSGCVHPRRSAAPPPAAPPAVEEAPPPVQPPIPTAPPSPPPIQPAPPPAQPALPAIIVPPKFERAPMVRLWLSDASATPEISCAGPCRVVVFPDEQAKRHFRIAPAKAAVVPGGIRLGDVLYKCSSLEIEAEPGAQVRIGGREYPGTIRLLRSADRVTVIVVVDAERYLLSVVGGEMPADWPAEALKAQAVAARTLAIFYHLQRAALEYDLTSTVEDQVFGAGKPKPSIVEAVGATRGEVLLHDGALFPAFYHSTCGGETESPGKALGKPEYDFLVGVPCGFCTDSSHYEWKATLSAVDLESKLKAAGIAVGAITAVTAEEGDPRTGRMVKLDWPGGSALVPIVDFRRAVGRMEIESGKFQCRADGGDFRFTGRGFGHGAGMCQYGCRGMARVGRLYREILMHYYRNCAIGKLY